MQFVHPIFLFVAAGLGLGLVLLTARVAFARRRALLQLGSRHLLADLTASVSPVRRYLKSAMLVTGVVLLAVALARPQLGFTWQETHRKGVDLLFAVDTSKSMLTRDVAPDRLDRAKLAVKDLVERFPADRVGLVAFAGKAFLETPLTLDHGILEESLDGLDTNVVPLGGTNVASAIRLAEKTLRGEEHEKVLVLLTDGEDLSGDALAAAEQAAKAGLVVHTVGVGTPSGELIPLPGKNGHPTFVKNEEGKLVTSRLDETLLRQIAAATHGTYHALGDAGQGLVALYKETLSTMPGSDLASRTQKVPIERFQWPLGLGLLLVGVERLVGERRLTRARRAAAATAPALGRRAAPAAAAAAILLASHAALASPQSAHRAYTTGDFARAEKDYASASAGSTDPKLDFNLGSAAYKAGDLDTAATSFEKALRSEDLGLQEHAYYNLGDTLYRRGEASLKSGKTEDTVKAWKQSIADYDASLHLTPGDADAKFNKDLVEKKLRELEKKQDEQQKQQPENGKSGDSKKDDASKKGNGGGKGQPGAKQGGKGQPDQGQAGDGKPQAAKGTAGRPDQAQNGDGQPEQPADKSGQGEAKGRDGDRKTRGGASAKGEDDASNDKPKPEGDIVPNTPSPEDDADEAPARPGELSKKDARALLDSLRGDLLVSPRADANARHADTDEPKKDW